MKHVLVVDSSLVEVVSSELDIDLPDSLLGIWQRAKASGETMTVSGAVCLMRNFLMDP